MIHIAHICGLHFISMGTVPFEMGVSRRLHEGQGMCLGIER